MGIKINKIYILGLMGWLFGVMGMSTEVMAYEVGLTTSGSVAVDVTAAADGANLSADNLHVTSTCPAGYTLQIKGPSNTNLYPGGDSTQGSVITASSGTYENPVPILGSSGNTSYVNTWGYTTSSLNGESDVGIHSNFVGLTGTAQTITEKDSASAEGGDDVTVYYGVSVDRSIPAGTYTMAETSSGAGDNVISYYLLNTDISCVQYTVHFNPTSTAGGTTLSGTGTMADQKITEGVATALSSNTFTAPSGYQFGGWNTAQDGSGVAYSDGQEVTDLVGTGETVTLYAQWREPDLYDTVAAAWVAEGSRIQTADTNTNTGIQATITTSNSGVFKYDPTVFGAASDASSDHDIYYYRGILDTTTGTYGSNGDNAAHPNTVLLDANKNGADTSDTCWRIVRTTGSGGVKMIYQGKWTGSTCANAQTNAQVATSAFNGTSSTYQQIVRVGYTYNSTYATNSAQTATIANVLGSDSNPSVNNTRSDIKTYIEDTWYTGASGVSAYTSILEPNAGYCNDRTVYDNTSPYTLQPESTNIVTYGTSGMTYYRFGSNVRNFLSLADNNNRTITLNCARSTVDLYRYDGTNGAAGSATANYLKYPAALLTADEAAFAGSGTQTATQGSSYHANSFLRSGSYFWLLSPSNRTSSGYAREFYLSSSGGLYSDLVSGSYGVRPSISLASGTSATSGTGTAADPWIVPAP